LSFIEDFIIHLVSSIPEAVVVSLWLEISFEVGLLSHLCHLFNCCCSLLEVNFASIIRVITIDMFKNRCCDMIEIWCLKADKCFNWTSQETIVVVCIGSLLHATTTASIIIRSLAILFFFLLSGLIGTEFLNEFNFFSGEVVTGLIVFFWCWTAMIKLMVE
jgi:hypothetical protein